MFWSVSLHHSFDNTTICLILYGTIRGYAQDFVVATLHANYQAT